VDKAINGEEAISKMLSDDYRIVILDIRMPGLNGIDVMRKVKKEKKLPPVVVLTAYDNDEIAREVTKEGAMYYMPKPVNVEHLIELIKKELNRKDIA
jgi:two-component system response regulator YesN